MTMLFRLGERPDGLARLAVQDTDAGITTAHWKPFSGQAQHRQRLPDAAGYQTARAAPEPLAGAEGAP